MKTPDRKQINQLEQLPNIGKAGAADLRLLGIEHPRQLIGRSPIEMYQTLGQITRVRHDPCVLDVFMSVVDFMQGAEAQPWWAYSAERKQLFTDI